MQFRKLLLAGAATTALASTAQAGVLIGIEDATGAGAPQPFASFLSQTAIDAAEPFSLLDNTGANVDVTLAYEFEGANDDAFSTFNGGTFVPVTETNPSSGQIRFTLSGAIFDGNPTVVTDCPTPAAFTRQEGGDGQSFVTFTLNGGNCLAVTSPNNGAQAGLDGLADLNIIAAGAAAPGGGFVGDGSIVALSDISVTLTGSGDVTATFQRVLDPSDTDTVVQQLNMTQALVFDVITVPNESQVAIFDAEAIVDGDNLTNIDTEIDALTGATTVNGDADATDGSFTAVAAVNISIANGDVGGTGQDLNGDGVVDAGDDAVIEDGVTSADLTAGTGRVTVTVTSGIGDALDLANTDGIYAVALPAASEGDLTGVNLFETSIALGGGGSHLNVFNVDQAVGVLGNQQAAVNACDPATAVQVGATAQSGETFTLTGLDVSSGVGGGGEFGVNAILICAAFDGVTPIQPGVITVVSATADGNDGSTSTLPAVTFNAEHIVGLGGGQTEVAYVVGPTDGFFSSVQLRNVDGIAAPVLATIEFADLSVAPATGQITNATNFPANADNGNADGEIPAGGNVLYGIGFDAPGSAGDLVALVAAANPARETEIIEALDESGERAAITFLSAATVQATGLLISPTGTVTEIGTEFDRINN